MICKHCGKENGYVRKCCGSCGHFLEGRTINNVTGKMGYRHADGSFTVDPDQDDDEGQKFIAEQIRKGMEQITKDKILDKEEL